MSKNEKTCDTLTDEEAKEAVGGARRIRPADAPPPGHRVAGGADQNLRRRRQ